MNYVSPSTQYTTNALLFGSRWGAGVDMTNITYSFPGLTSTWTDYTDPGEPYQGFTSFSVYEQQAVRNTLLAWSSVANLNFTEVADDTGGNGTIRIAYTSHLMDAHQLGYAYLPNDLASGGDVWLNGSLRNTTFQTLNSGTLGGFALMHELGHALGLKHSAETSAYSSATLSTLDDTIFNTVMSFNAMPGVPLTLAGNIDRLPSTPMSYDIDALQYLYGANTSTHNGDDHYVFAGDGKYLQTIYDAGGIDTIELTGTQGGEIDLRPGEWSQLGVPVQINGGAIQNPDTVQIYHTTLIENAIGSDGNDNLIGNDVANILQGNGGNDTIIGGAGCDTLTGGTGADCYVLATDAQDIITDFSITDGDKIDLSQIISSFIGYTIGNDPFANGYLSLSQLGGDTLIAYDTDGAATTDTARNLVTFQNFNADSLNNVAFIQGIEAANPTANLVGLTINGTTGNDDIVGGNDDDTINGLGGSDTISGGNGNDAITVGNNGGAAFTTLVDGGAGTDRLDIAYAGITGLGDFAVGYNGTTVTLTDANGGVINFGQIESLYVNNKKYNQYLGAHMTPVSPGHGSNLIWGVQDKTIYALSGSSLSASSGWLTNLEGIASTDNLHYVGSAGSQYVNLNVDRLIYTGSFTVDMGGGNDSISSAKLIATDSISLGAGDDFISVMSSDLAALSVSLLDGGIGTDTLSFGESSTTNGQILTLNTANATGFENLTGGGAAEILHGDAGDNRLDGDNGTDTLYGYAGNDTLIGDGYWSPGSTSNDLLYGGDGDDQLIGVSGDDLLDGGTGADTLTGGGNGASYYDPMSVDGTDTFVIRADAVDTITDFVAGFGGEIMDVSLLFNDPTSIATAYVRFVQSGSDTLFQYDQDGSAGSIYTFQTIAILQGVTATDINAHNFNQLTRIGTEGDDVLIGGLGVDTIDGGAGNDILDGVWGDDNLIGGTGDDTYHVHNLGDIVSEIAGAGNADKVLAAIDDYHLANEVEDLDLGNGVTSGNGNAQANKIRGNEGSNTIDGGQGADRMEGGLGADTYIVDDASDDVFEADNTLTGTPSGFRLNLDLGSNIDKVITSISYTLGNYLENLELASGSGNLSGTGNALDNVLTGNSGNNTLAGAGGNDVFAFATSGNGTDTITDFSAGDSITVTGATFSGAAAAGNGSTVLANQIQLASSGGTTTLYIGTDSIAGADIQIQLNGTFSESAFSLNTNRIVINTAPTGSVTITGTATQGQTLTAAYTLADADGLGAISYQWQADGSNISGATSSTYTLTDDQCTRSESGETDIRRSIESAAALHRTDCHVSELGVVHRVVSDHCSRDCTGSNRQLIRCHSPVGNLARGDGKIIDLRGFDSKCCDLAGGHSEIVDLRRGDGETREIGGRDRRVEDVARADTVGRNRVSTGENALFTQLFVYTHFNLRIG